MPQQIQCPNCKEEDDQAYFYALSYTESARINGHHETWVKIFYDCPACGFGWAVEGGSV